jgi:hypothetical protein
VAIFNDLSWVITSPAVADGKVFFATSDSSLYHVVDANSGKPILRQQGKAYMFSSPAVGSDVVFIGVLNGTLEARDIKTATCSGILRSRSPSGMTVGYLQAIESLMGHFSSIPTGVKHRLLQPINKFASGESIRHRSS